MSDNEKNNSIIRSKVKEEFDTQVSAFAAHALKKASEYLQEKTDTFFKDPASYLDALIQTTKKPEVIEEISASWLKLISLDSFPLDPNDASPEQIALQPRYQALYLDGQRVGHVSTLMAIIDAEIPADIIESIRDYDSIRESFMGNSDDIFFQNRKKVYTRLNDMIDEYLGKH